MAAVSTGRIPRRERLRILLAAAEPARRASLAALVAKSSGAPVEIRSQPAISGLRSTHPFADSVIADVVIVDISGPSVAASLLQLVHERMDDPGVVVLIDDPDPRWVRDALQAGVNAIISREPSGEDLRLAVTAADAGLVLLYPASAQALLPAALKDPGLVFDTERLTARESEVLLLMSEGLGNKEIAARLAISEHTAKSHISSILGKMSVGSRTEAVSQGIKQGLIPI